MIFLAPEGGLCNRLRTMESGLRLAKACGSKIVVFWVRHDFAMRQYFGELFQPLPGGVRVIDMSRFDPVTRLVFSRLNPRRFRPEKCNEFVDYCLRRKAPFGTAHFNCVEFYAEGARDYGWLRPLPRIQAKIDEALDEIGTNAVGIHIRRTDNEWSKKMSPLALFEQRIAHDLERDPDTRYFLATDDQETKEALPRKFPGRIHTRKHVAERDAASGVADAVVDLMLLSKMSRVYGSFGSSFSVVAAQIGGCPLEILKIDSATCENDERFNWKYAKRGQHA